MLAAVLLRAAHRSTRAAVSVAALAAGGPLTLGRPHVAGGTAPIPVVRANDGRRAAGRTAAGAVDLVLTARVGRWYPDGDRRPAALLVPAFADGSDAPSIPGPLLRVRAGTRIRVTVRNALEGPLAGAPLVVHGLFRRPASGGDTARAVPLHVPPGAARTVDFEAGAPGTYYYWGSVSDTGSVETREGVDAALAGAFVVDPADGPVAPDRVFVITRMVLPPEGEGTTRQPARFAVAVNGLSWPHTERLDAAVGDTVRWRWVNATSEHHPMHLHGFYYHVDALGDGRADTLYAAADRKLVVTERMVEGGTMALTWVPERAGNWLVHCHLRAHSAPDSTWGFPDVPGTGAFGNAVLETRAPAAVRDATPPSDRHASHDMARDMAGLVLGIRVREAPSHVATQAAASSGARQVADVARHDVRLTVLPPPPAAGRLPQLDVRVDDPRGPGGRASAQSAGIGPPIMLRRGEPARITVVNRLAEATALHWHGIELESYFDGVPGWTGGPGGGDAGGRRSPAVAPGDSFAVLMTPPRAGTFIYHSHALSTAQVGDGLYGPLIILDAGETYDPSGEVTWIVGGHERGDGGRAFLLLNGERAPAPLLLAVGRPYRVRLINISESNTADVTLLEGEGADASPVTWRPLAKDAIPLSGARASVRQARLRTSVGETYDFEMVPPRPGVWRLEVRNGGDLMVRQQVLVR